jgi:hypothetical protein
MYWLVVRNISSGGKMALQTLFRGIPVTNVDECRITFNFDGRNASDLDFVDYH